MLTRRGLVTGQRVPVALIVKVISNNDHGKQMLKAVTIENRRQNKHIESKTHHLKTDRFTHRLINYVKVYVVCKIHVLCIIINRI